MTSNTWSPSPDHPGYRCKTLQRGNCTITILRPELSDEERKKREDHTRGALERALRDYYIRKEANT